MRFISIPSAPLRSLAMNRALFRRIRQFSLLLLCGCFATEWAAMQTAFSQTDRLYT
jgi:hypothetical protein